MAKAKATGSRGRRPAASDAAINRSASARSNRRGSDTLAIYDSRTGKRVDRRRFEATARKLGRLPRGYTMQSKRDRSGKDRGRTASGKRRGLTTVGRRDQLSGGSFR